MRVRCVSWALIVGRVLPCRPGRPCFVDPPTGYAEAMSSPAPPKEATARLRDAIELLEAIAADRTVLAGVPDAERKRLLQAVALVYSPDRVERRRMSKIAARQRKATRVRDDQGVLHETGIRSLRRKPVFHTPNVFPAVSIEDGFTPRDAHEPGTRNSPLEDENSGARNS